MDLSWIPDVVETLGPIAETVITTQAQKKGLASQQAHQEEMAEQQAKLLELQAQAAEAQEAGTRAQGALQGLATVRTLLVVGGVVLGLGVLAATVVALRRES
tara:strand:- start:305 stop:610 length:306 start_codon:yes stop_codon:yes gene_type:complete